MRQVPDARYSCAECGDKLRRIRRRRLTMTNGDFICQRPNWRSDSREAAGPGITEAAGVTRLLLILLLLFLLLLYLMLLLLPIIMIMLLLHRMLLLVLLLMLDLLLLLLLLWLLLFVLLILLLLLLFSRFRRSQGLLYKHSHQ